MSLIARYGVVFLAILNAAGAVKDIVTHKEFTELLKEAGSRPVIIDYWSQSCGPCHMIAPVFRKLSKEYAGRAYFRKIDVQRNQQTASYQGIRAMPTFQFWLKGKKQHQFNGADEGQLRKWIEKLVKQADADEFDVTKEALMNFYKKHDASKATKAGIDLIYEKNKKDFPTMVRLLKKKYGEAPATVRKTKTTKGETDERSRHTSGGEAPSLDSVPLQALKEELERREEDMALERMEEEEMRLSNNPCSLNRNRTAGLIEKVVIIGGGPAGMTAAIYAARANLCPLIIAPAVGGQLMAKGVDVENYPGMPREDGRKMIEIMKRQARSFFTEVIDDSVISVNTSTQPFQLHTNESGIVKAHTVILATGADSKWLHAEGEWEYRGHGVSSCATCDGYIFAGKPCAVVGGGDTAMEEALFLSRICSNITLIHRRDAFRASLVMQERVLQNPKITVRWNSAVSKFVGDSIVVDGDEQKFLTHVELQSTQDKTQTEMLKVDAAFVAIGHDPNTGFVKGQIAMDATGYLELEEKSTRTSVPGIFAAGDVADHTYRQAVTSAGSGAMAALDAERYLSEITVEEESCVRQEDFTEWSMEELKDQVALLGLKCTACTEKQDFIASIRAAY